MERISRIKKEQKRIRGLFINTLLASAGVGSISFLVTAIGFHADGLTAFLMAYVIACMAAVINPLWLLERG